MTRPDGAVGVVLAAGRGVRFGGTKQLAEVDGQSLASRVVAVLAAGGLPVVVVVGHDHQRVIATVRADHPAVEFVENPDPGRGMGSSLAVAAAHVGPRPIVVVLADQPGIRSDDVHRVVSALDAGASVARIVHPDGPGHPVGFAAHLHPRLMGLAAEGAGRGLADEVGATDILVDRPRPPDVDTVADLEAVRTTWTASGSGDDAHPSS